MNRKITTTSKFDKEIKSLIAQNKLTEEDYNMFKRTLISNPDIGDLISGTSGMRKTRLKSSNKGKRGGFRICYFDDPPDNELFLILIYPKNEQEDLTSEQKKSLKNIALAIKARGKNG